MKEEQVKTAENGEKKQWKAPQLHELKAPEAAACASGAGDLTSCSLGSGAVACVSGGTFV